MVITCGLNLRTRRTSANRPGENRVPPWLTGKVFGEFDEPDYIDYGTKGYAEDFPGLAQRRIAVQGGGENQIPAGDAGQHAGG